MASSASKWAKREDELAQKATARDEQKEKSIGQRLTEHRTQEDDPTLIGLNPFERAAAIRAREEVAKPKPPVRPKKTPQDLLQYKDRGLSVEEAKAADEARRANETAAKAQQARLNRELPEPEDFEMLFAHAVRNHPAANLQSQYNQVVLLRAFVWLYDRGKISANAAGIMEATRYCIEGVNPANDQNMHGTYFEAVRRVRGVAPPLEMPNPAGLQPLAPPVPTAPQPADPEEVKKLRTMAFDELRDSARKDFRESRND